MRRARLIVYSDATGARSGWELRATIQVRRHAREEGRVVNASATITLSAQRVRTSPGEQTTTTITVVGRSPFAEEYLLTARGIDPTWVTFRPPIIRLSPGGQAMAVLVVRPPMGSQPANVAMAVRLVSQRSGAIIAEAPLTLVMAPEDVAAPDQPGASPPAAAPPQAGQATARQGTPRLLIGGIVVGVVALIAVVGATVYALEPKAGATDPALSVPRYCAPPTGKHASLSNFQDDPATAILLGNEDETDVRVLRTEPSSILPGNFDAMLALSPDASRLAYVTAKNLMLDGASISYIDVARPSQVRKLVDVPVGLWIVQPVWSPDDQRLAYAKVNEGGSPQSETQLELWVATVGGKASRVATVPQSQLDLTSFYGDRRASLCWASDNKTLLIQNVYAKEAATATPNATQTAKSVAPTVAPSPTSTLAPGETPRPTPVPTVAPTAPPPAPTAEREPPRQIQIDTQTGQAKKVVPPPNAPTPAPGLDRLPPREGGSPCGVPVLSQNDPAWRASIMQAGGDTIGSYGCALTSTAMMLNYFGATISPPQLGACLGSDADLLQWWQVNRCSNGVAQFKADLDFSWERIDAQLATGSPVILGFRGGPAGMHFVVVTAGGGGDPSNYAITDPWDGTTDKTIRYFIARGYVPTWIVVYAGAGKNCTATLIRNVAPTPQSSATRAAPLATSVAAAPATPLPIGTAPPATTFFAEAWRTPGQGLPSATAKPVVATVAPTATRPGPSPTPAEPARVPSPSAAPTRAGIAPSPTRAPAASVPQGSPKPIAAPVGSPQPTASPSGQ